MDHAKYCQELEVIATQVQNDLEAHSIGKSDEYESVLDFWEQKLQRFSIQSQNASDWYSIGKEYWSKEENCTLDEDGVLGGYGHVSDCDIFDSKQFLENIMSNVLPNCERNLALDCGAGIGRVSKFLLTPNFKSVDLVEQSDRLLQHVPLYMGKEDGNLQKVRNIYCTGLQQFEPAKDSYDVIWVQWVLLYLTDVDLLRFLKRCQTALRQNGWICIKENVILDPSQPFFIDNSDSSLTRSDVYYKSIFKQANLQLLSEQGQLGFPDELYPVRMYALK